MCFGGYNSTQNRESHRLPSGDVVSVTCGDIHTVSTMMSQKIKWFSHSSVVLTLQSQQAASTLSSTPPAPRPAESETQDRRLPSALTSPPGDAHTSERWRTIGLIQLSGPGRSEADEEKPWENPSQLWSHPQLPRKAHLSCPAWTSHSLEPGCSLSCPSLALGQSTRHVEPSVLGQVWSARPCLGGNMLDLTIWG